MFHKIFLSNIRFIILFSVIPIVSSNAQTGWFRQVPAMYNHDVMLDIQFINHNTGYAVGTGIIMKTTNGGINWFNQVTKTRAWFYSVCFVDSSIGYVCGNNIYNPSLGGFIMKTTNGGGDWNFQNYSVYPQLLSIDFVDPENGFAAGLSGTILHTTNGGINWDSLSPGTNNFLKAIQFLDRETGYAGGANIFLKTTDGGVNWDTLSMGIYLDTRAIFFSNVNTGYATGSSRLILKTTNGGSNWIIKSPSSNSNSNFRSIEFVNINTGFVAGDSGRIMKTTNGGDNWFSLNSGVNDRHLRTVYFTDINNGYSMGDTIYIRTSDGGLSWTNLPSTENRFLLSVSFGENNIGYIVGQFSTILKTTNGGIDWVDKNSSFQFINYYNVYFPNSNTGYISKFNEEAWYESGILKTTNAGENWSQIYTGSAYYFFPMSFINELTGYIFAQTIQKTIDGGANWTIQNSGLSNCNDIYFLNNATGYICGNNGNIAKTTSGGNNWEFLYSGTGEALYTIHFTNVDVGYSGGTNGRITKTTNGGLNWNVQLTGIDESIYSIYFQNENIGYAVGDSGAILYTTNGGGNWNFQNSGTTAFLFSINFINSNTGYIVGEYGMILKTTTGGIITGFSSTQNESPREYYLLQNYPNPFNPNTIIHYSIPTTQYTVLKVYNVLGNEVATLINEEQNAGSYSVEFSGGNYPSGIYYYKLETGNFSDVRKMILLK